MGKNWHDYIKEAKRCLVTNGILIIAETMKSMKERLSKVIIGKSIRCTWKHGQRILVLELLEKGTKISEKQDGSFAVPSLTSTSIHEVRLIERVWVCTCPDFEYREVECFKHVYAVRFWVATNTYLQEKPKPKVFAEDAILCDKCGSIRVVKYGTSANKQIFKCKDCQHKFREPSLLKKAKFTPELVTLTLDLYFSGLSLRKIVRNVNDHFDIELGATTIYNWIQKYIPSFQTMSTR